MMCSGGEFEDSVTVPKGTIPLTCTNITINKAPLEGPSGAKNLVWCLVTLTSDEELLRPITFLIGNGVDTGVLCS